MGGTGYSGEFTDITVDEDGTETQSGRPFMDKLGVRMARSQVESRMPGAPPDCCKSSGNFSLRDR